MKLRNFRETKFTMICIGIGNVLAKNFPSLNIRECPVLKNEKVVTY